MAIRAVWHLGVILSSNLNWSSHACNMLQTAAKRAGLLRVMSNDLPLPVATQLYIYYVRPTMEYASAVWHGSLREDNAMSIERIQASVARPLLRANWLTPKETAPVTTWMASAQMAARDLQLNTFLQTTTQPPRATSWVAFSIRTHNIKSLSPQTTPIPSPTSTHSLNYLTIYTTYIPIVFLCNNYIRMSFLRDLFLLIYGNM